MYNSIITANKISPDYGVYLNKTLLSMIVVYLEDSSIIEYTKAINLFGEDVSRSKCLICIIQFHRF